jgi:hypothetical protein
VVDAEHIWWYPGMSGISTRHGILASAVAPMTSSIVAAQRFRRCRSTRFVSATRAQKDAGVCGVRADRPRGLVGIVCYGYRHPGIDRILDDNQSFRIGVGRCWLSMKSRNQLE